MIKFLDELPWESMIGQIVHGDCRDLLRKMGDKSVDLCLVDPPYGIGKTSGTISKKRGKNGYDVCVDSDDNWQNVVYPVVKECLRVAKRVIITPGNKHLTDYPKPDSVGVMYQPAAGGMQQWGFADGQVILYYGRDPRVGKTISPCSFVVTESARDVDHPCPKPLKFWEKLLLKGSLEGDLVLDPFMGSWTTARACKNLGRRFIGCEISEKYCRIGEERLRQEILF